MIDKYRARILEILDPQNGLTTGHVAECCQPWQGRNRHTHSKFIRRVLLDLEYEGKVRRLDDQKPDCWVLAGDPT